MITTLQDSTMLILDAYVWPFLTDSEREAYWSDDDPLTAQVCVDREEFERSLYDNGCSSVEGYLESYDRDGISYIISEIVMRGGAVFAYCNDLKRLFIPPTIDPDYTKAAAQEFIEQRVHSDAADTVIEKQGCENTDTAGDDISSSDDVQFELAPAEAPESESLEEMGAAFLCGPGAEAEGENTPFEIQSPPFEDVPADLPIPVESEDTEDADSEERADSGSEASTDDEPEDSEESITELSASETEKLPDDSTGPISASEDSQGTSGIPFSSPCAAPLPDECDHLE